MTYRDRILDKELERLLKSAQAVVLEGPRAIGKTETARQYAASAVFLDIDTTAQEIAKIEPALLLEGPTPRLIDEWQIEPRLWNLVRHMADERKLFGQFILTGSSVPAEDITRHTGAGRIERLKMRPMTFYETGHSSGDISLAALFAGQEPKAKDPGNTILQIIDRVCIGGWPTFTSLPPEDAQRAMRAYLGEIARTDIARASGVKRNSQRVTRVLRSVARNVSTQASINTIAADAGGPNGSLDSKTVAGDLSALEQLMIIEDQPAWAPDLRSRIRLRSADTRHFIDPCLAAAVLGASPAKLLQDPKLLGFLFESLVVRDLRVYVQPIGGQVLHYRDSENLEVDVILELDDGRWAGVEVKLGAGQVDSGARSLIQFANKIDTERSGEPIFLAVVTATGYAYKRPDDVYVLPIGALKP
jgi:predicted AAA+ superfamily ATPase